jgi:hypothetical protein
VVKTWLNDTVTLLPARVTPGAGVKVTAAEVMSRGVE